MVWDCDLGAWVMYISLFLLIWVTASRSPYLSAFTIICFFHYVQGPSVINLQFVGHTNIIYAKFVSILPLLTPLLHLCRRSLVRRSSSAAARWSSTWCVFTPGSWVCEECVKGLFVCSNLTVWGSSEERIDKKIVTLRRWKWIYVPYMMYPSCTCWTKCVWVRKPLNLTVWELWMYDTDWRGVMVLTHWLARCHVFSLQSFRGSSAKWTLRFFSFSCLVIIIILAKV